MSHGGSHDIRYLLYFVVSRIISDGVCLPVGRFLALSNVDEVEPDGPPVIPLSNQPHATLVVMAVEEQVALRAFPLFAINGREEPDLGGVLNEGVDSCEYNQKSF